MTASDIEEVRRWASELSSGDVVVAAKARQLLERFMSPVHVLELWRGGRREVAAALLSEAEAVGCPEVYALLGECLKRLLGPGCEASLAAEFLHLDESHVVVRFLLAGMAHEDVGRARCVRPALVGLLSLVGADLGSTVGDLLCEFLRNERVLRLFDEGSPESVENGKVCEFLAAHTDLLHFIVDATLEAFESDPLLVANYLLVCGVMSRHTGLSPQFLGRLQRELTGGVDSFLFPFVCRSCSIALNMHEENAVKYAEPWVVAVAVHLSNCGVDSRDAIYGLLGAASTTAVGWRVLQPVMKQEDVLQALSVKKTCDGTLSFLSVLVESPFVPDVFFNQQLLTAVWQLRSSQEDSTRGRLWEFILKCLSRKALISVMCPLCASYLCSSHQEHLVGIRELQLGVATRLADSGVVPPEMVERLRDYISRGLYPPGSVGVATMSR